MNETEKIEQEVAPQVQETKKVRRRGITNETIGATRLKFNVNSAQQNGLFIAHFDSITVERSVAKEAKVNTSFNGLNVPRLQIVVASNETNPNDRRYATLSLFPVESNAETIPSGKGSWKVDSVLSYIKHILDVLVFKGKPMTEEHIKLLSLDYDDMDDDGGYVPVDPEVVVSAWDKLFSNVVNLLNTGSPNGGSVYKINETTFVPIWVKLLCQTKNKGEWYDVNNGELGIPQFVGDGVFELYVQSQTPKISVNAAKESLVVKVDRSKTKEPNALSGSNPMGVPGSQFSSPIADPLGGGIGVGVSPFAPHDSFPDL